MQRLFHLFIVLLWLGLLASSHAVDYEYPGSLKDALEMLGDPDAENRALALLFLNRSKEEKLDDAFDQIIDLLDDESRVVVRDPVKKESTAVTPGTLATKLMATRADQAFNKLSTALVKSRPTVRWRIAHAFGKSGLAQAAEPLIGTIANDSDKLVQMTAAEALVSLGELALPKVLEMLDSDNLNTQAQAIWILSEIKDDRMISPLLKLAVTLNDKNAMRAKEALFKLGPGLTDAVLKELKRDNLTATEKQRLIVISGQLPDTRILQQLVYTMVMDPDDDMRTAALVAASMQRNPMTTDAFMNLMADRDPTIAQLSAAALARLGPQSASLVHQYIRQNPEIEMREYALGSLQAMERSGIPILLEILNDERMPDDFRRSTAQVLKLNHFRRLEFKDRLLVDTLLNNWKDISLHGTARKNFATQLLRHHSPDIRQGGVMLLGGTADIESIPALVTSLRDSSYTVRNQASKSLQRMGPKAYPALLKELGSGIEIYHRPIADMLQAHRFRPRTDMERIKLYAAAREWSQLDRIGELAVAYLLEVLLDNNLQTSLWAAWTLAQFNQEYDISQYEVKDFDKTLILLLSRNDSLQSQSMFRSLMVRGDYEAVAYLMVPLFSEDEDLIQLASEALGGIGIGSLEMVNASLNSSITRIRRRALQPLSRMGPTAVTPLLNLIKDPDIGKDAYFILEEMKFKPRTEDEVMHFLEAGRNYQQIARKGNIGLPFLFSEARDQDNPMRADAVRALGKTQSTAVIPVLIEVMSSKSPDAHNGALEAFRELGEVAIDELRRHAMEGHIFHARWAAEALGELDYEPVDDDEKQWLLAVRHQWPELTKDTDALNYLRKYLLDLNNNKRAIATAALSAVRDYANQFVTPEYAKLDAQAVGMLKSTRAEERAEAADLMARYPTNAIPHIPALIDLLGDNTPILQFGRAKISAIGLLTPGTQAAVALGTIGEPALKPLMQTMQYANTIELSNALLAISGIAVPEALPALEKSLADPRLGVRLRGASSLSQVKSKTSVRILMEKSQQNDLRLNNHIRDAIIEAGDGSSVHLLALLDEADDANTMRWIIQLLGELGENVSEDKLLSLTETESIELKKLVFRSLSAVGGEKSVARLIKGLKEDSWTIREVAADALIDMGAPAVGPLIQAFQDKRSSTNRYIYKVLKQITNRDMGENKKAWQNWHTMQESMRKKQV